LGLGLGLGCETEAGERMGLVLGCAMHLRLCVRRVLLYEHLV